jgi:phage terminase large subunit GpA-like protein
LTVKHSALFWQEEREAWQEIEDLTISEWADKFRVLTYKAAKNGPWETSFNPVMRTIMDAFGMDGIEEISVVAPTQCGKTDGVLNVCGYWAMQDPGTTLIVEPNEDLAGELSKDRVDDMIQHCDALLEQLSDDPSDTTKKKKTFKSMTIYFGWAGSPTSLASRPCRRVLFDEVNKYGKWTGEEASPLKLGKERTNTFIDSGRLIGYLSTPTTDKGYITVQEKQARARFRFLVSCPHCGHKQRFVLEQIRFGGNHTPDAVEVTAWYECEVCQGKITENQRMEMVRRGDWYEMQEKDGKITFGLKFDEYIERFRPKSVGFQFNRINTPWFSFGAVAAEFLRCKDIPEDFMNFKNSWMAEEWQEFTPEEVSVNIITHITGYQQGEVPKEAIVLTAGADLQKAYHQFVIRAWSAGMRESWLIYEDQIDTWEDFESLILGSEYRQIGSKNVFKVRLACADSGYRTSEVYDFARVNSKRVRAIKGVDSLNAPYKPSKLDYYPSGKRIPGGLTLWHIDTGYWKDYLARRMNVENGKPILWHLYDGVSERYLTQVNSEHKVKHRSKTTKKITESWELKPGHKRNEALDCEVYASAAAHMLGIGFTPGNSQRGHDARKIRSQGVQ